VIAPQTVLLMRARKQHDNLSTTMSPKVKYARYSELLEMARRNNLTMLASYFQSIVNDAQAQMRRKENDHQ